MADLTVQQAWDAIDYVKSDRDYKEDSVTVSYIVMGSESDTEVLDAVREFAPDKFMRNDNDKIPIPRHSVSIEERLTQTDWKVNVSYQYENSSGGFDDDKDEESTYEFEISTATKHVVFSRKTRHRYPSGAKNEAGINDGEGIDCLMPVSRFSETHYFKRSKVTAGYQQKLTRMVGTVNKSKFKGYDAHEVLFVGARGTRTGKEKWQITFSFMVAPNEDDIKIGRFSNIQKNGWDVIWARYKEASDDDNSEIIRIAKAVFVEEVYREKDFSSLGLGN